jgi:CRP-like cAMP-binding protein
VGAGGRILLTGPLHQELVLIGSSRAAVRCAGEQVVELGPDDIFGELAPQRATYATAKVVALTDLRLVLFSTRHLRGLAQTAPDALAALCAMAPSDRAEMQCRRPARAHLTLVPPPRDSALSRRAARRRRSGTRPRARSWRRCATTR